jgi:hypothetical protein
MPIVAKMKKPSIRSLKRKEKRAARANSPFIRVGSCAKNILRGFFGLVRGISFLPNSRRPANASDEDNPWAVIYLS